MVLVSDITGHCERMISEGVDCRVEHLGPTSGEHNGCSISMECPSARQAYPGTSSGDERDLAGEGSFRHLASVVTVPAGQNPCGSAAAELRRALFQECLHALFVVVRLEQVAKR